MNFYCIKTGYTSIFRGILDHPIYDVDMATSIAAARWTFHPALQPLPRKQSHIDQTCQEQIKEGYFPLP